MAFTRCRKMFIGSILIGFILLVTGLIILPTPATVPNQSVSDMYNAYTIQVIYSKEFIVIMVGGGMVFVGGLIWAITECSYPDEPQVVPTIQVIRDLEAANQPLQIQKEKSVTFVEPVQGQALAQPPVQYARPAIYVLPNLKKSRPAAAPLAPLPHTQS